MSLCGRNKWMLPKVAELDAGFNASTFPPAKSFFLAQGRVARLLDTIV